MGNPRSWHRSLRARLALAITVVLALALYGLVAGGSKSAVPLQAKPTAASNAGFSVSEVRDAQGNIDIAALGANNSLMAYWEIGAHWYGPLLVNGPGTTFSAPKLLVDSQNNLVLTAQGPGNRLWAYWNIGGIWYGPLGVGGAGSTFSSPASTVEANGTVDISVMGPGNSLLNFWEVNAAWYGPYGVAGPGTTYSTPSMDSAQNGGNNYVNIEAQGPNNDPRAYQAENGTWFLPQISAPNEQYSASSTLDFLTGPGSYASWMEGPGNSLIFIFGYVQGGTNTYCVVSPQGEAFSAPDINPSDGTFPYVGPNNSLRIRFYIGPLSPQPSDFCDNLNGANGPLGISGANTAFSVPSIVSDVGGDDIAVQGPNHSLWVFFDVGGNWMGPIGVGAPGSTFSSPN